MTPAAKTADRVEHSVVFVEAAKKRDMLVELFDDAAMSRASSSSPAPSTAPTASPRTLDEAGIDAAAIHGNKSQGQRERALGRVPRRQDARAGRHRHRRARHRHRRRHAMSSISNCREVAEAYVHRIGRTARAGEAGQAISLCDHEERDLLRAIERLTRLTLLKTDRRGAAGPKPAPVVRKAASAPCAAPSPKRPHHMPHRDARGGRPVAVETRPGHRPDFRSGGARLGREVKGRR